MATTDTAATCCDICKNIFTDPRLLPCLHSFCLQCIMDTYNEEDKTVTCRLCREVSEVECVDSLHENVRLNDQANQDRLLQKITLSPVPECEVCDSNLTAVAYCDNNTECGFICKDCHNRHQHMKKNRQAHIFIALADLTDRTRNELLNILEKTFPSPSKCAKHSSEELDYHCNRCFRPACSKCVADSHNQHGTCNIDVVMINDVKENISSTMQSLTILQEPITTAINETKQLLDSIHERGEEVARTITETFAKIHELLHEKEKQLCEKTKEIVQVKINRLEKQLLELVTISTSSTHYDFLAQNACKEYSNPQLLAVAKPLTNRAIKLQVDIQSAPTELCDTCDISCDLNTDAVKEAIANCGSVISTTPNPDNTTVIIPRSELAIDTEMKVIVISKNDNGQEIYHGGSKVKAKMSNNDENIPVTDCDDGKYVFNVRSVKEGKQQLSVSVNGHSIKNSPFPIHILPKHDYKNFKFCLQTISNINSPMAITFSNKGRMYVSSKTDQCVYIVKSNTGQTLSPVLGGVQSENAICKPVGIDIVNDDMVYITDAGNHNICTFSNIAEVKMKRHLKKGVGPERLLEPTSVKISPDNKIYVSDSGNHRVQVFNRDWTHSHIINIFLHEDFTPQGMAFDLQGNVHIAGGQSKMVAVYSPIGEWIRHYITSTVAIDVAVDSAGYSLVVGGSTLCIFNKDGASVHSVEIGKSLTGIAASPYGSIWLTDCCSNKIMKIAMDFFDID